MSSPSEDGGATPLNADANNSSDDVAPAGSVVERNSSEDDAGRSDPLPVNTKTEFSFHELVPTRRVIGEKLGGFSNENHSSRHLIFSGDGSTVIQWIDDRTDDDPQRIESWTVGDEAPRTIEKEPLGSQWIGDLSFDGRWYASSETLYDLQSGRAVTRLADSRDIDQDSLFPESFDMAKLSDDGKSVVGVLSNKFVRWDTEANRLTTLYPIDNGQTAFLDWRGLSKDGDFAYAVDFDAVVHVFDLARSTSESFDLPPLSTGPWMTLNPEAGYGSGLTSEPSLYLVDMSNRRAEKLEVLPHHSNTDIRFSADGKFAILHRLSDPTNVLDPSSDSFMDGFQHLYDYCEIRNSTLHAIATLDVPSHDYKFWLSDDGTKVVFWQETAQEDVEVSVWSIDTLNTRSTFGEERERDLADRAAARLARRATREMERNRGTLPTEELSNEIARLNSHCTATVGSGCFGTPDLSTIMFPPTSNRTVILVDPQTGQTRTITCSNDAASKIYASSPDSSLFVTKRGLLDDETFLEVRRMDDGEIIYEYPGVGLSACLISEDNKYLSVVSDRNYSLHDLESGKLINSWESSVTGISGDAGFFSPDGRFLFSAGSYGFLQRTNGVGIEVPGPDDSADAGFRRRFEVDVYPADLDPGFGCHMSPASGAVATWKNGYWRNRAYFSNLRREHACRTVEFDEDHLVADVTVSPTGKLAIVRLRTSDEPERYRCQVIDLSQRVPRKLGELPIPENRIEHPGLVQRNQLMFSADGSQVAVVLKPDEGASGQRHICVFDLTIEN